MTMGSQQQVLVAGAIEAAEIVSERKVREVEDRVTGHIRGVHRFAEELDTSLQALKAATVVLAESYDHMPALLRADLAGAVSRVQETLTEVTLRASAKGVETVAETLRVDLQKQVTDLTERVFGHLEGLHKAALKAQDKASDDALRGMMAHLADLSRDLARGAREELTQIMRARLAAADSALEERLAAGRTVEDELRQIASRVSEDYETLKAGLEASVEARSKETTEGVQKTVKEFLLDFEGRAAADLSEDLSKQLEENLAEHRSSAEQERQALHDELRTGAALVHEETHKACLKRVEEAVAAIPEPKPGPRGDPGPPGAVGQVKAWERGRLHSRGTCVTHFGGIWQARANTEDEPGHSVDWEPINRGVESAQLSEEGNLLIRLSDGQRLDVGNIRGPQGPGWEHRGVYNKDAAYARFDVVIVRGTSYLALKDAPGECPGAGWQMIAQAKSGPAGKPGKPGRKGDPGPPGPIGPPGVVPRWRGRYVFGEDYLRGESVHFNGSAWIALQDGQLSPPKADGEEWDLQVHGVSGSQGGGAGSGVTSLSGEMRIQEITQADYDALSPPHERTLYLICG